MQLGVSLVAADEVEATVGRVDLLVNNAGVILIGPTQQATYQDWDFMLGVTLGAARSTACKLSCPG
jgi:NADP-dependent 3-hydroxy acid dehydrogenase YdfG